MVQTIPEFYALLAKTLRECKDPVTVIHAPRCSGKTEALADLAQEWRRKGKRVLMLGVRAVTYFTPTNTMGFFDIKYATKFRGVSCDLLLLDDVDCIPEDIFASVVLPLMQTTHVQVIGTSTPGNANPLKFMTHTVVDLTREWEAIPSIKQKRLEQRFQNDPVLLAKYQREIAGVSTKDLAVKLKELTLARRELTGQDTTRARL